MSADDSGFKVPVSPNQKPSSGLRPPPGYKPESMRPPPGYKPEGEGDDEGAPLAKKMRGKYNYSHASL